MARILVVVAVLLGGCSCTGGAEGPVCYEARDIDPDRLAEVLAGAEVWGVSPEPAHDGCGTTVVIESAATGVGLGRAFPDEPRIIISSLDLDTNWRTVGAHEWGHILLYTWEHVEGPDSLMSKPHGSDELTRDDLRFACRTAGICDLSQAR